MLENTLNNKTNSREDQITSTIIGLLKYLPSELFWNIIRNACNDNSNLPKLPGDIDFISFWDKWSAEETINKNYVEPDVFIQFSEFNVIIEVKPYEDGGQYKQQWRNQITAYNNEFTEGKKLIYISLGGNYIKTNDKLIYKEKEYIINKCNWTGILLEVSDVLKELKKIKTPFPNKLASIRILEDVIRGFNFFGYFDINWFEGMNTYTIDYE